jgi:hypothetical protein
LIEGPINAVSMKPSNCDHCGHPVLRAEHACPECGRLGGGRSWRRVIHRNLPLMLGVSSVLIGLGMIATDRGVQFAPQRSVFGNLPIWASATRFLLHVSPFLIAVGLGFYAVRKGDLADRILGVVGIVLGLVPIIALTVAVVSRH